MALSYRAMWWARWRFPKLRSKLPDPCGPPKYGERIQRLLGYIFFAIYATAGLEFYALLNAMKVRQGEGRRVTLEIRPSARSESMDLTAQDVLLLGTTTRFTIVYDVEAQRAWSLPHDSIARIIHPRRKKDEGAPQSDPPGTTPVDGDGQTTNKAETPANESQ
jgi:hypothetical protein